MEYLYIALGCLAVVLLVMLLVQQKNNQKDDGQLQKLLAEDNARLRAELTAAVNERVDAVRRDTQASLDKLNDTSSQQTDRMRRDTQISLEKLTAENAKQLDTLRTMVEQKLGATLNERLTVSFANITEQLKAVSTGLEDVRTLSRGVNDLQKVMTNVKERGTWGESQCQALLDQILAPNQYHAQFEVVPGSNQRVDFAIRIPSTQDDTPCYLSVDVKFPQESYLRLLDAPDELTKKAEGLRLEAALRTQARDIAAKYICPPHTLNFAVMYLPSEGLYAEVNSHALLVDEIQQKYNVILAGPTTLMVILNMIYMNVQAMAVERRSADIFKLLQAVRTEFDRYHDELTKAQKQLGMAQQTVENLVTTRANVMRRKLKDVDALEPEQAENIIGLPGEQQSA